MMIKWFIESGLEKLHFPISKTKPPIPFLTIAATLTSLEDRQAQHVVCGQRRACRLAYMHC